MRKENIVLYIIHWILNFLFPKPIAVCFKPKNKDDLTYVNNLFNTFVEQGMQIPDFSTYILGERVEEPWFVWNGVKIKLQNLKMIFCEGSTLWEWKKPWEQYFSENLIDVIAGIKKPGGTLVIERVGVHTYKNTYNTSLVFAGNIDDSKFGTFSFTSRFLGRRDRMVTSFIKVGFEKI